jgi:hypothetical protein
LNTVTNARRFNVTSTTAIYAKLDYGPTFGGHDFTIKDMSNINNNSYSQFGQSYQYPGEFNATSFNASNYLTGCIDVSGYCKFSTVEIEVFQLVNKSLANATTTTAAPTSQMPLDNITSSTILNSTEIQKVYELCQFPTNRTLQLLYRATRDNFSAAAFHSKCDGFLNTLSIIKSTNDHIFGGFTTQSWTCAAGYRADPSAFILSLRRNTTGFNTVTDARRFNITSSGYAIIARYIYGPTFGGHDFTIRDMSNINNNSYSTFGKHYQYPSEFTAQSFNASNYLTGCVFNISGVCSFSTVEIEVYKLI